MSRRLLFLSKSLVHKFKLFIKEERLFAPYMAGEDLLCKMDGMHEIEFAFSLLSLIYDRLQCRLPFGLFFRARSAGYGLCFRIHGQFANKN